MNTNQIIASLLEFNERKFETSVVPGAFRQKNRERTDNLGFYSRNKTYIAPKKEQMSSFLESQIKKRLEQKKASTFYKQIFENVASDKNIEKSRQWIIKKKFQKDMINELNSFKM